jgi:type IV pilus assembly protein PilA
MRRIRARVIDERGFTLVEVLTVMMIIPILASIAIPTFLGQKEKAEDPQAKSAVRNAASAIELYYTEKRTYAGVDATSLRELEPSLHDVAAGDLTVTPHGDDGYAVTVKQPDTGNTFTITKADGGFMRTCTVADNAGCPPGGKW